MSFEGKWKLESSENFDEYMQALGVNFMLRKVAATAKPAMIITRSGDVYTIKSESSVKNTEFSFKFGEEFDETTADGRKSKSTITKDSDKKWTHVQKSDPPSTMVRELTDDDTIVVTCVAKDVTSKRVYKRSG